MTWSTKGQIHWQKQWQRQIHLENIFTELTSTGGLWDICIEWWENMSHDLTKKIQQQQKTINTTTHTRTKTFREHLQMTILEKLWKCWHFWQLRTSNHYNHSDLTIKSDTGQHSQLLRCLYIKWPKRVKPKSMWIFHITKNSLVWGCEAILRNIYQSCENKKFRGIWSARLQKKEESH